MQAPIVVDGLKNTKITSGLDAKFRVKFEADPLPKITWIHNENILRQTDRIKWCFVEVNNCLLVDILKIISFTFISIISKLNSNFNFSFTIKLYLQKSVCELSIKNVVGDDSGAYAVRLQNPAGKAGSQAFLLVKGNHIYFNFVDISCENVY